jgi:hypothetical protein
MSPTWAGVRCACGRDVMLCIEEGRPSYWAITPFRWQDLPTAEEGHAAERRAEDTYTSLDEAARSAHRERVEAGNQAEVERVRDEEAVARLIFSPSTICDCGRRYRALGRKPWIAKSDEAEGMTPRVPGGPENPQG